LPAAPTILALRTTTDWLRLAQYPTSGVLVDGSKAQSVVAWERVVDAITYLRSPCHQHAGEMLPLNVAVDERTQQPGDRQRAERQGRAKDDRLIAELKQKGLW
jgi:hypothetical protein